jgi:hypothetical protein
MSVGTLLGIGRFAEVDASIAARAEGYRAGGPPTLLHWSLQTLGYSALFQGRSDDAERSFEESVGVAVPDGALSANKPIEARVAFRQGNRSRALMLLRSYLDDLAATDNVVAASVVGIEFVPMLAATGGWAEAGHVLGYLEATNDFGARAASTLLAEATNALEANAGPDLDAWRAAGRRLGDREAMTYMRDALDRYRLTTIPQS